MLSARICGQEMNVLHSRIASSPGWRIAGWSLAVACRGALVELLRRCMAGMSRLCADSTKP